MRRLDRALGRPVQRYDRIRSAADQGRKRPGPGGSWDVPGVAARTGVQIYEDERGTVREYRPHREVMDPESLATLRGVALTLQHPGQGEDPDQGMEEITPQTYRDLTHGTVLDVAPDSPQPGLVEVWTRLQSERILAATSEGTRELSCGYEAVLLDPHDPANAAYVADLGPEPGVTHDGQRYDLIQTRIRYNHLAVVDQARAGSVARLRFDGKAAKMKRKITLDGKTHELAAWIVDAAAAHAIPEDKRADAGEVLEVSVEGMDKPLALTKEMVEVMLNSIGANGAMPGAPAAEPMEAESEDALHGMPDEMMMDQGQNPNPEEMMKADDLDKKIDAMVNARVDAVLAKALPQAAQKIATRVTDSARERAALERAALPVLGPRFDYQAHDEVGIALEVIKADGGSKVEQAQALAERARKGDARAAGRLEQLMDDALDRRRDTQDSSHALGEALFSVHQDSGEPQDTRPLWEQRQDQIRKGKAAQAN